MDSLESQSDIFINKIIMKIMDHSQLYKLLNSKIILAQLKRAS